jgi:hypothetical protein
VEDGTAIHGPMLDELPIERRWRPAWLPGNQPDHAGPATAGAISQGGEGRIQPLIRIHIRHVPEPGEGCQPAGELRRGRAHTELERALELSVRSAALKASRWREVRAQLL